MGISDIGHYRLTVFSIGYSYIDLRTFGVLFTGLKQCSGVPKMTNIKYENGLIKTYTCQTCQTAIDRNKKCATPKDHFCAFT